MRIHETLGEDLWGFMRLWERIHGDLQDFGRIHQDLQGFVRLWERICEVLGEDSRDFARGFGRTLATLGEDWHFH